MIAIPLDQLKNWLGTLASKVAQSSLVAGMSELCDFKRLQNVHARRMSAMRAVTAAS